MRSDREFARYVRISLVSATESENHLILVNDLGLIEPEQYTSLNKQTQDVQKMLSGFEDKLTRDAAAGRPLKGRTASRSERAASRVPPQRAASRVPPQRAASDEPRAAK